mmetsp:Transcript_77508/g.137178  ORF Transcript_77508/g.137178 Transcript_77508/m.137178 type:complete len:107 (+) Transcript_77508:1603-1923(+)
MTDNWSSSDSLSESLSERLFKSGDDLPPVGVVHLAVSIQAWRSCLSSRKAFEKQMQNCVKRPMAGTAKLHRSGGDLDETNSIRKGIVEQIARDHATCDLSDICKQA